MNEETNSIDKDIELMKIKLYSELVHSKFVAMFPTSIAIFLAFLIAIWTFFIEGIITDFGFLLALIVMCSTFFTGFSRFTQKHKKNLNKVSNYLEMVQRGESVPKLIDM